jgi:hypothetical protein
LGAHACYGELLTNATAVARGFPIAIKIDSNSMGDASRTIIQQRAEIAVQGQVNVPQ